MRRFITALMTCMFLLSACGSGNMQRERLDNAREKIALSKSLCFTADVSVELTDSVFDCTLKVERSGETISVTVLQPEEAAGISAVMSPDGAEIEYGELVLGIGDAVIGERSPIAAMSDIVQAMENGFITMLWSEACGDREFLAAQCYISDDEYVRIWFDEENMLPLNAELVSGDTVVVKCRIEDITMEN